MRVISGTARGRRLAAPPGERVRPTADRVKEALFSILTSLLGNFEGIRTLDIFAGTGNLGIEALSRGGAETIFIDNHRESAATVKKNLDTLGFAGQGTVVIKDAVAAIAALEGAGRPFQLILLDPPYRLGMAGQVLERLAGSPLVADETIIMAETADDEEIVAAFGPLRMFDRRVYGDTALSFFRKGTSTDHA
ncbi:16S rRNA (guanine(966)-N(2))-methyltransferase RsmD [Geobacter pickeringii]|uniref:Methyltransferase n=1 Tax=Geobacter pickeringii TaxID=345632 RepID=A0A0B5BA79_9BACT|nr:16S rRNA (guanine(966)-N(2))-methyltransferase RsmD [Geobacter pickeringii]AJE03623.1 methyltransferase [Geobacter pickeringii]